MTVLENLWNGWRSEYIRSVGAPSDGRLVDESSVFTRILGSGLPDEETLIVHRGDHVFAIMNAFPYSVGHVLVLPYREVGDLELLTFEETTELWQMVTQAVRVVKAVLRPGGVNVGLNLGEPAGGSIRQHLHVHIVPRWYGDANFMTATANTRSIPEALPVTTEKLRGAWATLA